jgi:rhamnulokinase
VVSVPFESPDAAYLSSGTWSLLGIETRAPLITERTEQFGLTNEGGVAGTIRVLKNICGLWLVQECRRKWAEDGDDHDFAELADMASQASAFQSLIDPDDESFAAPGDMPARIRAYCRTTGQYVPGSKGAVIRTALESLAHRYRHVLDMLEDVHGARIPRLHIVGGGIQNRLLSRLAASACGREVMTGPVEATSIGNVLVQMMAHGDVAGLDQARAVVRASFPVETLQPDKADDWEEQHRRFLALAE